MLAHQPQYGALAVVHVAQVVNAVQWSGATVTGGGVAGHSLLSQSHDTQLPTLGPEAVPWEQVLVLAHQPQLPVGAVVQV